MIKIHSSHFAEDYVDRASSKVCGKVCQVCGVREVGGVCEVCDRGDDAEFECLIDSDGDGEDGNESEETPYEDDDDQEDAKGIESSESDTPRKHLNMQAPLGPQVTSFYFRSLCNFAGEKWLCDGCVTQVAKAISTADKVIVLDPVVLKIVQEQRRLEMLEDVTQQPKPNSILYCPIFVEVPCKHWCALIVDMERCSYIIYDPQRRQQNYKIMEDLVNGIFSRVIKTRMTEARFNGIMQRDVHNCGVLINQFLLMYKSAAEDDQLLDYLQRGLVREYYASDLDIVRFERISAVWKVLGVKKASLS